MLSLLLTAVGILSPLAILLALGPGETPLTTKPQRIADIDAELFTLTADDIEHLRREESAPLHV